MTFFRSRWAQAPDGTEELDPGVLAPGFRAAGVACGLKDSGRTDLGLLACDEEAVSSAMLLTRNAAAAAPVRVCRESCRLGTLRGAVINSGNANAATGKQGYRDALEMRDAAAAALACDPAEVAVAETGVIGVPLDLAAVRDGIDRAASALSSAGAEAFAESIRTTDRWAKHCCVRLDGVTVSAQAKGGGMMEPDFATLLCFVQTDGQLDDPQGALRSAAAESFERITVDGQMSTNDALMLQASGSAAKPVPQELLEAVLLQLSLEVVADGEGATRVGRAQVTGAASDEEALRVARAIANSPLVKTALFGRDPNWGRIAQAAGMALAGEELAELGPAEIDANELGGQESEAELRLRLDRGEGTAHVYFSDLGYDYVKVNAEYRT